MNFEQLKALALSNEIRVSDTEDYFRTPPVYYDSLTHALQAFFSTYLTNNSSYNYYAQGLSNKHGDIHKRDSLDEDNTMFTLIGFERFFELFIKDLLRTVNANLIAYVEPNAKNKPSNTLDLVKQIQDGTFTARLFDGKVGSIPFKITLKRFYDMISLSKDDVTCSNNEIVRKFKEELRIHSYLDSPEYLATFQLLNWYRDKILHSGNDLPTMWFLDYLVTQKIMPIIIQIIESQKDKVGKGLFYLETLTKINLLEKFSQIKYEFEDLFRPNQIQDVLFNLLYIGHLKELGRATYTLKLPMRENRPTYEYAYRDPRQRARRFAETEKDNCAEAISISSCPCCAEATLVLYRIEALDYGNLPNYRNIHWVKCYYCDYYLWYNLYDPSVFNLSKDMVLPPPYS